MLQPRLPTSLALITGLTVGCGALGEQEVEYWIGEELHGSGAVRMGEQEGPWSYTYPDGQVAKQGAFEDDKQVGKWTLWYPDGAREQEGYFLEDGYRGGPWAYWNPDGSEYARGWYERGFEQGAWVFHDEDGALRCEGEFQRGRQTGEWRFYAPGGGLIAQGVYLDGEKIGTWRFFDAGGADAGSEVHAVPDGLDLIRAERADGSLERTGFAQGGRAVGHWTTRHASGRPKLCGALVDGRPVATWIAQSADGRVLAAGAVEDGAPEGEWHVFEDGAMRVVDAEELDGVGRSEPPGARPARPEPTGNAGSRGDRALDLTAWLEELVAPWPDSAVVELVPSADGNRPDTELARATDRKPEAPIAPSPITRSEVEDAPKLFEYYAYGDRIRVGERVESDIYGEGKTLGATLRGWRGRSPSVKRFLAPDMSVVDLDRLRGEPALLVILRGMPGRGRETCIYCNMQVKAYAARAAELGSSCEVLLVYPGPVAQLAAFQEAYAQLSPTEREIPFRLVADVDEALVAELGIVADLAVPTTVLLDREGRVAWSYRGLEDEDRPTVATLLRELEDLEP